MSHDGKTRSVKAFVVLLLTAAILAGVAVFLPQGSMLPTDRLPAPRYQLALMNAGAILFVYGGLGLLGLITARRLGWAEVWHPDATHQDRWVRPALWGFVLGVVFIVTDSVIGALHSLGPLPHPPFPTSVVASAVAAISEEVLFRLFLVPVGVWLLSKVIHGGRERSAVFWSVAVFSALAFAAGHLPSVAVVYGIELEALPPILIGELLFLNGILSLVAAQQLRRHGLLAAVGVHWWTDVIWHVVWGVM